MADNVQLPATGTGQADPVIAADDVGSVYYQRMKVDGGGDGATVPILAGNGTAASALRVTLPTDGTGVVGLNAGTNNIGDVDVLTLPALVAGTALVGKVSIDQVTANANEVVVKTGSTTAVTQGTAANLNATVVGTGTFMTQTDGAALTALQLIDDPVKVDDAAFTVAVSSVSMAGNLAVAVGADPDAADAGDAAVGISTRHRVPFVLGGHPNTLTLKHTTITTAVTDAAIVTISTGSKIVVTRLSVTLDNASTVFPTVLIGFGTANTPTTTGVIYSHGGFPAGGGMTIGDGSGIVGIGADDADLRVTTTLNATGNGLQIVVSYFLLPS